MSDRYEGQTVPHVRHLAPREVLDLHSDLHRLFSHPNPVLHRMLSEYAEVDLEGNPQWGASHLHPATRFDDLSPWFGSFATDLFGATTYQVTAEMVELAEALTPANPRLGLIEAEDLPAPWGFAWLEKPIPRPAVDDNGLPPQLMHAFSWAEIGNLDVRIAAMGNQYLVPSMVRGVRLRKWGYNNEPGVYPRPLHLMGQNTIPVAGDIRTELTDLHMIHMIWILMGMEITTAEPAEVGRPSRKRARELREQEVRVVRLRRPKRHESAGEKREVDWSCSWIVRGHWRKAPRGGTFADGRERTWIRPYIKGPDGLPLRSTDILYRLER